ncbi:cytochrome P450 [Streptomyces noursei]|uniref:cytochrome P450 n=1 Tax=Streptomyces noursei TaxID=1971 RepID=UPI00167213A4|nr:cytochrome P450 [Streptomyces noursei]MCZ1019883.1 cytochrome P450 [Streptomyces noursei]GGX34051.1 hypothetical protein GCM10010341_64450 [Streptomyces noursei]
MDSGMQQRPPARASARETVLLGATVLLPARAQGAVLRRPRMARLAARFDTNRWTHRTLARLRRRHGAGPVSVAVPGRRLLLLLAPQDARHLFTTTQATRATQEGHGALLHLAPHFPALTARIHDEAQALLALHRSSGRPLDWDDFSTAFRRVTRRVVLGDAARDAAAIAAYSALALLASHPEHANRVRAESERTDHTRPATADALPLLRASILESLRLWPTPLAILRNTTAETTWHNGTTTPADTAVVFCSTFFHRDVQHLPYADQFEPDAWLDGRNDNTWALAPLNHGPAKCPSQDLALYIAATLLAALLRGHKAFLLLPRRPLAPPVRLPHTIDHTSLRFALTPRSD